MDDEFGLKIKAAFDNYEQLFKRLEMLVNQLSMNIDSLNLNELQESFFKENRFKENETLKKHNDYLEEQIKSCIIEIDNYNHVIEAYFAKLSENYSYRFNTALIKALNSKLVNIMQSYSNIQVCFNNIQKKSNIILKNVGIEKLSNSLSELNKNILKTNKELGDYKIVNVYEALNQAIDTTQEFLATFKNKKKL